MQTDSDTPVGRGTLTAFRVKLRLGPFCTHKSYLRGGKITIFIKIKNKTYLSWSAARVSPRARDRSGLREEPRAWAASPSPLFGARLEPGGSGSADRPPPAATEGKVSGQRPWGRWVRRSAPPGQPAPGLSAGDCSGRRGWSLPPLPLAVTALGPLARLHRGRPRPRPSPFYCWHRLAVSSGFVAPLPFAVKREALPFMIVREPGRPGAGPRGPPFSSALGHLSSPRFRRCR